MKVPEEVIYTDQHEWIRVTGQAATVGITDHAQEALRDIVFVELPTLGRMVAKGEELGAVESSKAVVSYHAPVSGRILEVNLALGDDPGLVNVDPYGDGWICRISLRDPAELSQLMNAAQYERFCGSEQ